MAVGKEEEEEKRMGSLAPCHRPQSPELLQTLWSDPHSNSGIFIYFDMICPPWAEAVQRDEGPRSLWSSAGIGQGVICSRQRLRPPSSSSSSFLLRPFRGH